MACATSVIAWIVTRSSRAFSACGDFISVPPKGTRLVVSEVQDPIDRGQQAADLPLLGIPHVRDPEGLLLELPVAVGDLRPLPSELAVQVGDQDPARVAHAA